MKETFVGKSTEEYQKIRKVYQDEREKYVKQMERLKIQHKEKIGIVVFIISISLSIFKSMKNSVILIWSTVCRL
jgi:hypothetical protein